MPKLLRSTIGLVLASFTAAPAVAQVEESPQSAPLASPEEDYRNHLEHMEGGGRRDSFYLRTALSLALIYSNSGRHADAVPLYRKALATSVTLNGEEHAVTQEIRATLLLTEGYLRTTRPEPVLPPLAQDRRVFTHLRRVGGVISIDDYPVEALRADAQGTVGVELSITAEGTVSRCFVTLSSGSPILDHATCNLIRERFTYTPPTVNGRPVPTGTSERIVWRLPD